MSVKIFKLTQKIHKRRPVADEESKFSLESQQRTIDPALEVVKAVCKILSLNPATSDQVAKLKRNMLKLINIGEFSDSAVWADPCKSVVLSEVICKVCTHCRDIDLCKDLHVTDVNGKLSYECPLCQSAYDKTEMEYQLLNMIQKNAVAYTIQDLQCKKCLEIAADNLKEYCSCAGDFKTLLAAKNLVGNLKTLLGIGDNPLE